jgi:hypothetical protein
MAQVHTKSPFTAQESLPSGIGVPEYAMPQSRDFAAPGINEPNGTLDNPNAPYAVALKEETNSTPDPFRLGHMVQRQAYPVAGSPPEEYYGALGAELLNRHSVESQDADGWEENKGTYKRFAPNPRATPPPEDRPTMRMAPRTYSFLRPLWGAPRALNGEHFSMADHRRTYDILGTQPVRTWRNTYRIDPTPWDTNVVDIPPAQSGPIPQAIQAIDVPSSRNSAFRLV